MFKDFVKQQAGIELYPLISLCVFVAFFICLFIYVVSLRKNHIAEVSALPLGEDEGAFEKYNPTDLK